MLSQGWAPALDLVADARLRALLAEPRLQAQGDGWCVVCGRGGWVFGPAAAARCGPCAEAHDWAASNRAACDGLHRGRW